MRYECAIKDILKVYQGDAFDRTYQLLTTYDFTGKEVFGHVRRSDGDEELVLAFKQANNTLIVDNAAKTIQLKAEPKVIQNLMPGEYDYDIKAFTPPAPGTDDQRIMKGKFVIKATSSR
jgi:hypothetical protein